MSGFKDIIHFAFYMDSLYKITLIRVNQILCDKLECEGVDVHFSG